MTPSPARAEPHDATAWLPLPAPDSLPSVDELLSPSDLDGAPAAPLEDATLAPAPEAPAEPVDEPAAAPAEPVTPEGPGRAEAPEATAWLPLPEVDDLPPIEQLLDPGSAPPREIPAQPSPARAEPHDATAWLPLPGSEELPELEELPGATPADAKRRRFPHPHLPHPHLPHPHRPTRRTVQRVGIGVLVVATIAALFYAGTLLLDKGDDVTLRVDGTSKTVETGVSTVRSLLEEQDVVLGDFDRVSPALRTPIENDMIVSVVRAFPVPVNFDGETRTLYSTHRDPGDFVAEAAEQVGVPASAVALRATPDAITKDTPELQLRTKRQGTLVFDGNVVNYDSPSYTIGELLESQRVTLRPNDFATIDDAPIALDQELPPSTGAQSTTVEIVRADFVPHVRDEEYRVPPQRLPDPELPVGETRIQEEVPGIMRRTYSQEVQDGAVVDETLVSEVPVREAVPYVEFFGTKYNPLWDKMARCETGGNWAASGQEYQGGLGIYWKNWNHYGGREFAPTAGQATKYEQIIVAERIREEHGWHAWGCADRIGL